MQISILLSSIVRLVNATTTTTTAATTTTTTTTFIAQEQYTLIEFGYIKFNVKLHCVLIYLYPLQVTAISFL
jgi:hypothetical protein